MAYTTIQEDFNNLTEVELKEIHDRSFPYYESTSEEEWESLLSRNEIKQTEINEYPSSAAKDECKVFILPQANPSVMFILKYTQESFG